MDFFCFKLSNASSEDFANSVLNKEQDITISQLNQLADDLVVGKFIFINFGGDRVPWEKGLIGLAEIIQGPFDNGYERNNFRIRIKMQLVLDNPIKREEFIPYRDTYDAAGIGPSTRGEQNQAIKRVVEGQAAVIIRVMLDKQPDIESEVNDIFQGNFLSQIKGAVTMLVPQEVIYGSQIKGMIKGYKTTNFHGENILLYGVPGSGKSFTIKKDYCDDERCMERVVFHPEYSYTDFVGQILPKITGEKLEYVFTPGPFTRILKRAYEDPDNMYYLVIEEINRGNAASIFGDIFQLLDRDENGSSEYGITNADISYEVYGDDNLKIKILGNLTFLATMNTSDQNVFSLDTAFKRRWNLKMIKNDIKNSKYATYPIWDTEITWCDFATTINELVVEYNSNGMSNADKRLGAYFIKAQDIKKGNRMFPEKVLMYLWDDVFKFEREEIFNTDKYPTLEAVVEGFVKNNFEVFNIKFHSPKEVINNEVK